jgi:hypothetical protein
VDAIELAGEDAEEDSEMKRNLSLSTIRMFFHVIPSPVLNICALNANSHATNQPWIRAVFFKV